MNSLYVLNNLIAQGNAGEPVANTDSFWDPMLQLTISSVFVLLGTVSTILVTGYNERKRHRLTANLERKQAYYSELFEFIFKVMATIEKWKVDPDKTFPLQEELDKLLRHMDGTRIYALNNIWASQAAQKSIRHFFDLGNDYRIQHYAIGTLDENNAELENIHKRLDDQVLTIKKDILDDLEINQPKTKKIWKISKSKKDR